MISKALRIVLALALLASFACQSSRQSSQHKLLIYTPHGQDMLRDFIARYKQIHPEVEVQFLDMGSREVLERLRAERNRPQADLGLLARPSDCGRRFDIAGRGRGQYGARE